MGASKRGVVYAAEHMTLTGLEARRAVFVVRWGSLAGSVGLLAALGAGCGGSVSADPIGGGGDPSSGGAGATGGAGGGGGGVGGSGGTGAAPAVDAGSDAPYVDPGCPNITTPPPLNECDPFATPTGCRFDQGCYPFVDYPSGKCETERYGTLCQVAGTATQGELCEFERCAPGYMCVIGGAPGARCVQLCSVFGDAQCPPGLVCEPVDIQQGYGGCV